MKIFKLSLLCATALIATNTIDILSENITFTNKTNERVRIYFNNYNISGASFEGIPSSINCSLNPNFVDSQKTITVNISCSRYDAHYNQTYSESFNNVTHSFSASSDSGFKDVSKPKRVNKINEYNYEIVY